jgi:aryl-alcohol dehydrogenase-like predicted oxidoreductase
MKQVNLGSQGLRVPAIGLGCMGMSDFYGSSSEAQNLCVLDRAAEIGCRFWDTSDTAIPGTRRTERLEENWASQDITLRTEHLDRLESLINQGVVGDRY